MFLVVIEKQAIGHSKKGEKITSVSVSVITNYDENENGNVRHKT